MVTQIGLTDTHTNISQVCHSYMIATGKLISELNLKKKLFLGNFSVDFKLLEEFFGLTQWIRI